MCSCLKEILSYGEVVIAAIAVIVAIVTAKSQEKHNKNSVRPILNLILGDYDDNIYVWVENNGVGPACIKSVKCTYQGDDMCQEGASLIEVLPAGLVEHYTTFVEDFSTRAISPQQGLMLLQKKEPSEEEVIELRQQLKNCSVEITYTDIYGKAVWIEKRSLDFFKRTLLDENEELNILVEFDM